MKKVFRHIGYYNDQEDIIMLFESSADVVISNMLGGFGHFYSTEGDEDSDIENPNDESDSHLFKKTTDEQYLVRYEKGNDNNKGDGWFIDIYKMTEVETENDKSDFVEEYCGHCEDYVLLQSELKVQRCPNCGKAIVPCGSLCPMLDEKYSAKQNCSSCPLSILCEELNNKKEYVGKHLTLMETAYIFNTASLVERSKGFYITVPKVDENEEDEEIYIHYNKDYECIVVLDVAQYTTAYTIKALVFDRLDLQKALLTMFNRTVERLYVRKNY